MHVKFNEKTQKLGLDQSLKVDSLVAHLQRKLFVEGAQPTIVGLRAGFHLVCQKGRSRKNLASLIHLCI